MSILLDKMNKISVLGVLVSSCLVSGQAAAAWGNDSPWGKKHAAQKAEAAAEEQVVLDAPVIIEPLPVVSEPEPVAYVEPEPVVVERPGLVVDEPVSISRSAGDDILTYPGSSYAVQVYASSSTDNIDKYMINHGLEDLMAVKTDRNGKQIYVLVSVHEDRSSADAAASNLEEIVGSKPWVRSVSGLQALVAR